MMKAKLMHPMSLENYAALEESLIEVVTSLGFPKFGDRGWISGWWFQIFFIFTPTGEMIPI